MSLSLATPIIHGLGFTGPGFFSRALSTALIIIFYTLIHLYPFLALIFPLILVTLTGLYFWNPPLVLSKLTALFSIYQPADSLFWPLFSIAITTLIIYLIVFRARKSLPILLLAGLITTASLWYLYVDSAYTAAITLRLLANVSQL